MQARLVVAVPPTSLDRSIILFRWLVVLPPPERIEAVQAVRTAQHDGDMVRIMRFESRDLGPTGLDPNIFGHEPIVKPLVEVGNRPLASARTAAPEPPALIAYPGHVSQSEERNRGRASNAKLGGDSGGHHDGQPGG